VKIFIVEVIMQKIWTIYQAPHANAILWNLNTQIME
jgi:hypothetical protein